ncbi:MAG: hypothetical protein ACYC59_01695 [Anaerolineaceae bacterium]
MKKNFFIISVLVLLLAFSTACGSKSTPETKPTTIVINTAIPESTDITDLTPGEPNPEVERTLEDADASIKAYEKRAVTGDNILNNLFERPFTMQEMDYQPDLNILTVSITSDDAFFYFIITLDGIDPLSGTLSGTYGIEFDRTQTGRGDLLVLVSNPAVEWSMENVTAYVNPTASVGGTKPIVAEEGYEGAGYSETVELGSDQVAWARIAPEDPYAVQIAVSRALLDNSEEFLWGAWADGGVKDPSLFDYDDHFGPSEAGSPIKGEDYPVKAVYSLDNTCRLPYGLEDAFNIPGMCLSIPPKAENKTACVCIRWALSVAGVCLEWKCD